MDKRLHIPLQQIHVLEWEREREWRPTLSQFASSEGLLGTTEAQFSTHHGGCLQVPAVIADGAPFTIFQHFHSPFPYVGPASQAHQGLLRKRLTVLGLLLLRNNSLQSLGIVKISNYFDMCVCILYRNSPVTQIWILFVEPHKNKQYRIVPYILSLL